MIAACASPPPPALPLEVEYAYCKAVLEPGPFCVLNSKRELHLWVGVPPGGRIEIQIDGKRIKDGEGKPSQDGQQFSGIIPPGAKGIEVLVDGQARWSLPFAEPGGEQEGSRDVLREVREKATLVHGDILARRLAAVRTTLDGLRLPAKAPAESRYLVAFSRSLLAEREGDYRTALAEIQQAVEIAERLDMKRYRWSAEHELALLLRGVGRSRESAQLFDRLLLAPQAMDPCEVAELLNSRAWSALLAREADESFGDPTPLLERALETYATCERATPEDRANVLLNLVLAHLQEGRLAQAQGFLTRAHELEPHPPLPHTLWWLDLEARLARLEGRPAAALPLFDYLEELAETAGSPDGRLRAAFGQAQSHQSLGDPAAALSALRKAEALLDEQSLRIPVHEGRETFMATRRTIVSLHVELLLDRGSNAQALDVARHARSRMLRQLAQRDRLASLSPDRRDRWERLLAEYQVRRAALEERAKDDWRLRPDQLRREQAVRLAEAERVKALLDQAFLVLGGPGEQPGEEPPALRPGELILTYQPLHQGWVGFAADGKTVTVQRIELPPDVLSLPEGELSQRLLFPFRASIERAKRLRILSSGSLQGVDFHTLRFDGDILLASRPVVYGLDLPVFAGSPKPPGRHALLVADPRGDLPGTLTEARTVGQVLASGHRPWATEVLKNSEASAEAVRDRLAAVDLFHYAGHGIFSGFGGWESSLLLAEETRLTLGDFLALERVPAWVVLSGCDTGRSSAETPVESLGLAQAFLLAGSRAVVASTRSADDRTVPWFFAELYRQWDREPDLAVAFQRAQLAWRQRNPEADWKGFRLFEP